MKSLLIKLKRIIAGFTTVLMVAWLVAPVGVYAAIDTTTTTQPEVVPVVETAAVTETVSQSVAVTPVINSLTVKSSNKNPGWATIDDIVTIEFESSDVLTSLAVSVEGNSKRILNDTEAPKYSVTYLVDKTDMDGEINFEISYSDLLGGSVTKTETDITSGENIEIDITNPVLYSMDELNSLASLNKKAMSGSRVVVDAGVGVEESTGEVDIFTEWSAPVVDINNDTVLYKVTYTAKDLAGNISLESKTVDVVLMNYEDTRPENSTVVIDLLGEKINPTHAELGKVFKDAGAHYSWNTASYGDVVLAWVAGDLNTSSAKDGYKLTYKGEDGSSYMALSRSFNVSTVSTRIINVSDTTAPAPVKDFYLATGNGFVDLHWTNPTDEDFTGVQIYRSLTPGDKGRKIHFTASKTTNSFEDSDVINGTTYYYTLIAIDNVSNPSVPSVQLSATPTAPVVASADTSFGYDDGYVAEPEVVKTTADNEVKGSESKEEKKVVVAWYNKEFAGMKIWLWIIILAIVLGIGYWYFTKEEMPKPKNKPKSKKKK